MPLAFCTAVLVACGADSPRTATVPRVRDSAGVRVVENVGPSWRPGTAWSLEDTPAVQIGEGEQPDSLLLSRIWDVTRTVSGTFVLVDGAFQRLQRYAADGTLLGSTGRRGSGPGEFGSVYRVFACGGDTVAVHDLRRRLSIWDEHGRFVRELSAAPVALSGVSEILGFAIGCTALLARTTREQREEAPRGRDEDRLLWLQGDALERDTLLAMPGFDRESVEYGPAARRYLVPWSSMPAYAMVGERVVVGEGDRAEYRLFDRRGRLERIVRWHQAARPVNAAERDRFAQLRQAFLGDAVDEWDSGVPPLRLRAVPNTMPLYATILVDDEGYAWLREYDTRDAVFPGQLWIDTLPSVWSVFDSSGTQLGHMPIPSRLTVRAISGGLIVGVWRGHDDSESVRAYRVRKP